MYNILWQYATARLDSTRHNTDLDGRPQQSNDACAILCVSIAQIA